MKMKKSLVVLMSLWGLCLLAMCGCGSNSTPPPPPPPPPTASSFSVVGPISATAGTPLSFTVTALDTSSRPVTSYSGTVHLSSSDAQAALGADAKLTNGTGTFSVTLKSVGSQTITATDTAKATITGSQTGINISAAPAASLSVAGPAAASSGLSYAFTVTALDAFGNTATSYAGTVHFTCSDQDVPPPNAPLTNGVGYFAVTLKTITSVTITATDTVTASITGKSNAINVVSNDATHFSFGAPGNAVTRAPYNFSVAALDAANNTSSGYSGTVHFTSSDGNAALPKDAPLPNGNQSFLARFETPGNQTIIAADTVNNTINGTSLSIAAAAPPTLGIAAAALPNGIVGTTYYVHQITVCRPPRNCPFPFRCPCVPTKETVNGFTFAASGGVPPYIWSFTPGQSVVPGFAISSNRGLFSGVPTKAGNDTANVTVTDSGIPSVQTPASFPVVINNPPPPVIDTTESLLSSGAINKPFTFTFTASGGLPPYTWSATGALPVGMSSLTSGGVLAGTPTTKGTFPITVTVQDSIPQSSTPQLFNFQVFDHGFAATGSMQTARQSHTATLLSDGRVLVAGGYAGGAGLSTAEIFDAAGSASTATGSMTTGRTGHTATLIKGGLVLVAGGETSTAELFDPTKGTFSTTTSMETSRFNHTATLLQDGRVLVTGGLDSNSIVLISAEIYDPSTGAFSAAGSMQVARTSHTATLLNDGRVLVTGGQGSSGALLASAEVFDPKTKAFSLVSNMTTARTDHTATLLGNHKVLVAGGKDPSGNATENAELFDPASGTFSSAGTALVAQFGHTATLLSNGQVLLVGGGPNLAELYDPTAGTFTLTGSMTTPRLYHAAALLNDGNVLVCGGQNISGIYLATAELYQ